MFLPPAKTKSRPDPLPACARMQGLTLPKPRLPWHPDRLQAGLPASAHRLLPRASPGLHFGFRLTASCRREDAPRGAVT